MNSLYNFDKSINPGYLNKEDIILNFTPLREVMKSYKDKIVLITG